MMPDISLTGLVVVAATAFLVPLGLGLVPAVRIPSVVLEIAAGILIGPAVFGLVEVDLPLRVLALLGLAFLLLLAGWRSTWIACGVRACAARQPVSWSLWLSPSASALDSMPPTS